MSCIHAVTELVAYCKTAVCFQRASCSSNTVVPKLGAMAPPGGGGMGLLPGSHKRILKKYIFSTISVNRLINKECQGLILKFGLFEILEFWTH